MKTGKILLRLKSEHYYYFDLMFYVPRLMFYAGLTQFKQQCYEVH